MESESLLKEIELLSVQQINTCEINNNTKNFITVKETGKKPPQKLNHQQGYRIPLRSSFETLPIEEWQDKMESTDEDNLMLPSFDLATSKRRQEKQSTKHNKEPGAYITSEQYEEPLEQKKESIVPGRRAYSEATNFGKKIRVIVDSHLNRIKINIFQKSVNGGKHTLMFFEVLHLRK